MRTTHESGARMLAGRGAVALALGMALCAAAPAQAATLWFSNLWNWSSYEDGDVVQYDTDSGVAGPVLFDESTVFDSTGEDIYGFSLLENGNWALSTQGTATIAGLTFENEQIVEYDPVNDVASVLFDGTTILGTGAAVDAVHVCLPGSVSCNAGDILFSTADNVNIGGTVYDDDDIIAWNGTSASLFFDLDGITADDAEINAFHLTRSGLMYMSLAELETIGGTSFDDTAIIEFDPNTLSVTAVFDTASLGTSDVDALSLIPEPGSGLLLGYGLMLLAAGRRSRR